MKMESRWFKYLTLSSQDEEKGERLKAEKEEIQSELDKLYRANVDIQFMLEKQVNHFCHPPFKFQLVSMI